MDEVALSGMTLTAPPPRLERSVESCEAAAEVLADHFHPHGDGEKVRDQDSEPLIRAALQKRRPRDRRRQSIRPGVQLLIRPGASAPELRG